MRRALALGFALLASVVGIARAGQGAAPPPLPCGLPQAAPLWVDFADGSVPFWSTVFARPGVVGAAAGLIYPPQLRAEGAQTVYFDLYLNNRVGTPSKPADSSTVQARADKLFAAAVASSGCDHPLIAENELFGAQSPTPWTATTAQYRANVLAYLQRLADRGARPFLLLSSKPYTHDEQADAWWRQAADVADLVSEVYFSGPSVSAQGPVNGSRRLRSTMRSRMESLIQIGIPTSRLGVMLTFSSTPKAGGREGLKLSKWLDVTKWESLAAQQVSRELNLASVWTWGWATFNAAGDDPDKEKVACTWLWTRKHSLCDAPALAGTELDQSLDVGAALPASTLCLLGRTKLLASDVAALSRLTGDRELAFSAALQHAVLVEARRVSSPDVARAERDVVADRFAGSRPAYAAARAKARVTSGLAREILADELRRKAVEVTLPVPAPGSAQLRAWYATYSGVTARAVSTDRPAPWLGNSRHGVAIDEQAPGRLFALRAGARVRVDGLTITARG
ncbi:MAG: hypothetical protein H0X39_03495, partial [Actinobacteria bacterium]|nr:hypothetical protein [Actinomycetota bacterium]